MPISASRQKLRRKLRAQRAGLAPAVRKQATRAALQRLTKLRCFRRAQKIALYYPVGGEFNAALLQNSKAMRGKQIYLPVLARGRIPCLRFARWQYDTQWRPNRFGIAEPLTRPAALLRPNELDLVVTRPATV